MKVFVLNNILFLLFTKSTVTHAEGLDQSDGTQDPFAGFLFHEDSQKYYYGDDLPIRGPCGQFMLLYKDTDKNPKNAICKCFQYTTCAGRPLLYFENKKRCYNAFEQGPCKEGEWLINRKANGAECELNPCPLSPSTNDGYDNLALDFYFNDAMGKCYKTNTTDFCSGEKERVFFVGTLNNPPVCLDAEPDCPGSRESSSLSAQIPCPPGTKLENDNGCSKVVVLS